MARVATLVLPWVAFGAFFMWAWGLRDPFHTAWEYGDSFETIVTSGWFSDSLAQGRNPLVYPLNFFPEGWHVASHSVGTLLYLMLVPLVRLSSAMFAANALLLFGSALAFAGALLFARRHLTPLPATLVALGFAFGGIPWTRAAEGQLQVFLASTMLPWMLWGIDRAFSAGSRRNSLAWLALVGAFWAFAFNLNLYFVFIGGVTLVPWALLAKGSRNLTWQTRLLALSFTAIVFMILSTPWLILNLRESAIAEAPFYLIDEVNFSGASLNSFPLPSLFHPWLGPFVRTLYKGEPWEQALSNMGFAWSILAIAGIVLARRHKAWAAALALTVIGLVFALGLTLHWNGRPVQWSLLRPLNQILWQAGHSLKPEFFSGTQPPNPFADAVPLPGLLFSVLVPFFERGRMFARYAIAAHLGLLLLAGMGLVELGRLWPHHSTIRRVLQVVLVGILLIEIVPPRLLKFPFPPAGHEAYTWLSQQSLGDEGIVNLFAAGPETLVLSNNGPTLLAPSYHHQGTVAGAAGVRPRHNAVLNEWLATHGHPFWQPDFGRIMRAYKVRYILLEMKGEFEPGLWKEAQVAEELKTLECFPASAGISPWNWPICIAEVLPERSPEFNVLMHDGWSGMEEWGLWAEGVRSDAQFVLTSHSPVRLEVGAFPLCVPGKSQRLRMAVNGTEVAAYEWPDCEPWKTVVEIPADLVQIGFNDLTVTAAFAEQPPQDPRQVSLGFTQLKATAQPEN